MYLKSLELTGFKSFVEAKLEFPAGITAVVGPNGTGKTNVVDAILWVLGEQSTKTLRSERMEDVIFNGTEDRKPLGMAEVSLVIAGLDHEKVGGGQDVSNPLSEYHEVMFTRRLYRNGESEYLMNHTPCRLKDIRSFLMDTRAGIKGHTILEQGRLEQILNASPQDRRELIEETAGIRRYKKQKAEALRKVEATQQNLHRVRDIVTEVRRQLNSLERQARQARTYRKLQAEARALEIRLLVREARTLLTSQTQVESELGELEAEETVRAVEQARLTGEAEAVRLRITQVQESLGRIREELTRIDQRQSQALTGTEVERNRLDLYEQQRGQASEEIERLRVEQEHVVSSIAELRVRLADNEVESTQATQVLKALEESGLALADQRSKTTAEEDQAQREIVQSAVRVTHAENRFEQRNVRREELLRLVERLAAEQSELERELVEASEGLQSAVTAREGAEQRLQALQASRELAVEAIHRMEDQLHVASEHAGRQVATLAATESRLRALEGVVRQDMGYGRAGEEESTSVRACEGVRDALAEWLIVPAGLERAVEAVLGERGRAWLVEKPERARRAIDFLKQRELGRASFVPLQPRRPGESAARRDVPTPVDEPGVLGWAVDLVSARDGSPEIVACLFEGVLVVETLETALTQWERGSWSTTAGPQLVTRAGEIVDPSGVVTGGEGDSSGGLLQRRQEIQKLTVQKMELARAVGEAGQTRERLERERESGRGDLQRLDEEIRNLEMAILALRKDEEGLGQRIVQLARRLDVTRAEQEKAKEERLRLEAELEGGRHELARLMQEKAQRESDLAGFTSALSVLEENNTELQGHLTEARLKAADLRTRREHDEGNLTRLLKEQENRLTRRTALEQHMTELAGATEQSRAEQHRHEALARELGQQADRVRAEYVSAQESQAQDQESSRQVEDALRTVRRGLAANREARTAVEVRRAEIKTQLAMVQDTLSGTYQVPLAAALEQETHANEEVPMVGEGSSEEGVSKALRERLHTIRGKLERMGPVNLAAIEEHQALEERHTFLTTQEGDLSNSIKSLKEIIQRINRTTERMFLETLNELQEKFGEVFGRFFPGGRAELVLIEPQADQEEGKERSLEPGVDVVAQPPGKRLKSIAMLSGGEKTLTAMALIFASFLIRPTPFCILDEIDAPLDEENIGRFTDVLRELSSRAQFIVITHNKRTMAVADSLFGVTMEDPGVSQLLSVRLASLQPA